MKGILVLLTISGVSLAIHDSPSTVFARDFDTRSLLRRQSTGLIDSSIVTHRLPNRPHLQRRSGRGGSSRGPSTGPSARNQVSGPMIRGSTRRAMGEQTTPGHAGSPFASPRAQSQPISLPQSSQTQGPGQRRIALDRDLSPARAYVKVHTPGRLGAVAGNADVDAAQRTVRPGDPTHQVVTSASRVSAVAIVPGRNERPPGSKGTGTIQVTGQNAKLNVVTLRGGAARVEGDPGSKPKILSEGQERTFDVTSNTGGNAGLKAKLDGPALGIVHGTNE